MSDKIISQYLGDSRLKRNNLEIPIPIEAVWLQYFVYRYCGTESFLRNEHFLSQSTNSIKVYTVITQTIILIITSMKTSYLMLIITMFKTHRPSTTASYSAHPASCTMGAGSQGTVAGACRWHSGAEVWVSTASYTVRCFFLAGGGVSEAGEQTYCVCGSGEGWVFICLVLQRDKVKCTYGGEKTLK